MQPYTFAIIGYIRILFMKLDIYNSINFMVICNSILSIYAVYEYSII